MNPLDQSRRNRGSRADLALIAQRVVEFSRFARDNGFQIGVQESLDALTIAGHANILDQRLLRFGLRSLFCADKSDWQRFDDVFNAYWSKTPIAGELSGEGRARPPHKQESANEAAREAAEAGASEAQATGTGERRGGASRAESTAQKDFRHFSEGEQRRELERLIERLARGMRYRLSRRYRFHQRGKIIDLRRTIRNNLKYGGMPIKLMRRRRRPQPIKPVVFLDVSGSMNLYSRFFLRFVCLVLKEFKRADAFIFHTRLVHIRHALLERDSEKAMAKLALISSGWAGGTRIGESLATFNKHYAPQTLSSRTVVIILSDGLDTGAPAELGAQLKRLHAKTKKIIWLNPLLGRAGYQPLAQGMAAALPWVDLFASAHNLESLAALENTLVNL
ncbi:MAG TPA: VWA domain-containing protein [Acidiferrobacterales bacterium]|nr:VWA domain-containing protein [Acidiferrobacterales bacterium]